MRILLNSEVKINEYGIKITGKTRYSKDRTISIKWVDVAGPGGRYTGRMVPQLTTPKGVYLFDNYKDFKATRQIGEYLVTLKVRYQDVELSW